MTRLQRIIANSVLFVLSLLLLYSSYALSITLLNQPTPKLQAAFHSETVRWEATVAVVAVLWVALFIYLYIQYRRKPGSPSNS